MTDFSRELDRAVQSQRQQNAARRRQTAARQSEATQRAEQQRRQQETIDRLWQPVVPILGGIALEAANYLKGRGVQPEAHVHLVVGRREANFWRGAKLLTRRVPVWIMERVSNTQSNAMTATDYGVSSWKVTTGRALGIDGNVYHIATDSREPLPEKEALLTSAAAGHRPGYSARANVIDLLAGLRVGVSPIDTAQGGPNTPAIVEAWRAKLTEFVVSRVAR